MRRSLHKPLHESMCSIKSACSMSQVMLSVAASGILLVVPSIGQASVLAQNAPPQTLPTRAISPGTSDQVGNSIGEMPVATGDRAFLSQYLLGSGDRVKVSVFNAEDYSGEFTVLAGGLINMPLSGEVLVEGLTLQQASEQIAQVLSTYVRRPRVTVSLLAARPLRVAVSGEVNRPGAYTVTSDADADDEGSAAERPTLTQAIAQAGGITQSADIRRIVVQRQVPVGAAGNRSDAIVEVNLWQLLQEGQLDADLALQHGDNIIIPEAIALSPAETTALGSTSFSPQSITVNVVGEVESPGAVELPANAPLNQAILTAGGFNRRAKKGTVDLIRLNDNGSVTQQEIDVDLAAGLNPENNPALRPNDTVVVSTNGLNRVTDTLGTVLAPINSGFGLFRLLGL